MSSGEGREPTALKRWIRGLEKQIPPGQFGRYLVVGLGNTIVGYSTFALLTAALNPIVPHSYILASVISGVFNITVSYLNYKWFVFKTKGRYLREWIRCVAVYGGGIVIGTLLLPILVFAIRRWTTFFAAAPYIAGALLIAITTVYSFLGHKKFSFRSPA
jgi:putative flippase GtrA